MSSDALIKSLVAAVEPEGTIVTLTLDLAGTGTLPPATRVFLRDEVVANLDSEARPPKVRSAMRKIARRVTGLVETGLQPGTKGLFLVAGREIWSPVELKVRTRNFVTTGPRPFLCPLLAAESRNPRAHLVTLESRGFEIHEARLGEFRCVLRREFAGVPGDREHAQPGRGKMQTAPSSGGAERDRRQQRETEAYHGLVREAAAEIRALQNRAAANAVLLAGPRDIVRDFDRHLPAELKGRTVYVGLPDAGWEKRALAHLERAAAERIGAEVLEFHEARAEGGKVALGPNDVLQALWSGRAGRVYLDEFDPLPGVVCTGCGVHRPGLERRCPFCEEEVQATSIAQDIVAYSLSHKPAVGLTFVGSDAGWLKDLGGMAAVLALSGARRRAASALR